ncbi:hypothetical protein [Actinomadura geliboluensis]|uniref:hypothetical protein n=1 Tax=Actinomadura geliboluensis TaxID=882440 RepID=UPI00260C6AA8|nr:hypothetical protein [Actinomadura geliboluensis]
MDLDDVKGMVAPTGPDAVTPDLGEVQQQDPQVPALDVDVIAPVQVHALPARTAIMHNVVVSTKVTQLFGQDLRRGRVLLWGVADAAALFHVGSRPDEVEQGTCARILAGQTDGTIAAQVLELKHCEGIWAKADSSVVRVSFVLEQWAD